jgi:Holliday junction resolvase RusA-like endonuclease
MISFIIPGQPVAKGRPRLGRGRVYTPAKTVAYEKVVALAAKAAMRGNMPITGAVSVGIKFFLARPKSNKSTEPVVKPDIDNLAKSVCDALNGIVWKDDSQIVQAKITKEWALGRMPPCCMLEAIEL